MLKWLANSNRTNGQQGHIGFTISADMSEELRAECENVPESSWEGLVQRGGVHVRGLAKGRTAVAVHRFADQKEAGRAFLLGRRYEVLGGGNESGGGDVDPGALALGEGGHD